MPETVVRLEAVVVTPAVVVATVDAAVPFVHAPVAVLEDVADDWLTLDEELVEFEPVEDPRFSTVTWSLTDPSSPLT